MAEDTRAVLYSYSVTRFDDGSVDVKDLEVEGAAKTLTNQEIYADLEDVGEMIRTVRITNAATNGAMQGVRMYFEELSRQQAAAAAAAETKTEEK